MAKQETEIQEGTEKNAQEQTDQDGRPVEAEGLKVERKARERVLRPGTQGHRLEQAEPLHGRQPEEPPKPWLPNLLNCSLTRPEHVSHLELSLRAAWLLAAHTVMLSAKAFVATGI